MTFLNQVTTGLRNSLPAGSEITHAPMDSDIVPGKPYYDDVLKVTGGVLDFLMPQYYNGITRPVIDGIGGTGSGSVSALSHYNTIVDNIYGGDPTRLVFGFCISDCSGTGSNANAQQALQVMNDLAVEHPCNGGAFFWVASMTKERPGHQLWHKESQVMVFLKHQPKHLKRPLCPSFQRFVKLLTWKVEIFDGGKVQGDFTNPLAQTMFLFLLAFLVCCLVTLLWWNQSSRKRIQR